VLWLAFIIAFVILWALLYAALPALRYFGRRLTHLVARSARINELVARHKEWLPIVIIVVAGALLTAWAGDQFLDLAESVRANNATLQRIDSGVHDWAVAHRSAPDTIFFVVMTNVGSPLGTFVLVAVVAVVLAFMHRWRWVAYLAVTVGGGELLDIELKAYFARARPGVAEMLRRAHGYSFPSGHAMGSAVAFGALAYLAYRAAKSWPAATAALAFALTFVLSVALSRVYLGVHWISDVAAGVSAGLLWVTATTAAYETVRRIRHLRGLRASRLPPAPSAASRDREPSVQSRGD
jgi:membrane-associated phospholipid phosphatase